MTPAHHVNLLVSCPDASGLIAVMTRFLASHDINILDLDQHSDPQEQWFFARAAFDLTGCDVSLEHLVHNWTPIADTHRMTWRMHDRSQRRRVAILVSKREHCLRELLWRWEDHQLDCDIAFIASNHPDPRRRAERHDLPFHHLPVTPETRDEQESAILALVEEHGIDVVVLARYMRILSPRVVQALPHRIINIHHSFLPAFAGPRPYHQALERGVKLIGATCHYVTEKLDAGPIIEQAIARVDHRDTVEDLIRKGADLERAALVTGLRLHLQDRVLLHGRRTIIFD